MTPILFRYRCRLARDEVGTWVATFPEVPPAITQGATREEALENAKDALEAAVSFLLKRRKPVSLPQPDEPREDEVMVSVDPLLAAKVALQSIQRREGLSNVDLGRRLNIAEGEVRRMLDPAHPTKVRRLNDALRTFGQQLVVGVEAV